MVRRPGNSELRGSILIPASFRARSLRGQEYLIGPVIVREERLEPPIDPLSPRNRKRPESRTAQGVPWGERSEEFTAETGRNQ